MMDMNDMVDRCTNAMGSMMGNGIMLLVLLALLLLLFVWVVGLATVGALIFWVAKRSAENTLPGDTRERGRAPV
jgi:hypothetical protein